MRVRENLAHPQCSSRGTDSEPTQDLGSPYCSPPAHARRLSPAFQVKGDEGMSTTATLPAPSFLARERTIAGPGFSRWLIPPAALAIHLCIGMAYGFSVFLLPLAGGVRFYKP